MPRIAVSPADYLEQLSAGRKAAVTGALVNAGELARAAGVTWRILERWIIADPEFPVVQRGRMGEPWQFDLVAALDHLLSRARSLAAGRGARRAEVARLAGFGGAEGVPPSPDASTGPGAAADRAADARGLKALAEAQMTTHRLKQMQGEYVRSDAAKALLSDMMTTMQTETLAISSKLDAAGQWPPDLRASIEAELRDVLLVVQDKLDLKLREWGKGGSA